MTTFKGPRIRLTPEAVDLTPEQFDEIERQCSPFFHDLKQRLKRYNCHGCGRFLTDEEIEQNEVRCMGCA